ncbi:uncharacterized protein LOC127266535 [Andrographis paniculata]|uniref:uncharacterized protein LOC127266535 n=1 Tax=Andrographis paniculata TaxID=175694 RepID=UPI0021E8F2FA|nr:uncharacterized protein LOC127266535 [Andrographis paniculata]
MDPLSDLPPPPPPAPVPVAATSYPTPAPPPLQTHPSYAEMITTAVSALDEPGGSSRRAIASYIEARYANLPPMHSALLTHTLKQLKVNGHLVMVKNSYKLPSPGSALNGSLTAVSSESGPVSVSKRRPGRPPKPKVGAGEAAALPVFAPRGDVNSMPHVAPAAGGSPAGPINGPVRGRGRPRRQGDASKPTPAPAPKPSGGRGRGRPKKNGPGPAVVGRAKKGRGRPPKSVNLAPVLGGGVAPTSSAGAYPVVGGGNGVASVAGKRRGRPPKAATDAKRPRILTSGQPKTPRKLSGKPLGRPRKTSIQSRDSQLLVAYLDLKAKLENLQSRVKQTASFVKPYLSNEDAVSAVQELEMFALSVSGSSNSPMPHPQHPAHN